MTSVMGYGIRGQGQSYPSAAGGVLVLLTAHADRKEIALRLAGRVPPDCLFMQSEGVSLESVRQRFIACVAEGKRPLLLGVGAAWTGLDLSGDALSVLLGKSISAHADNVLADLVIPIAPVGTNRTLTQQWRRERSGILSEVGATSIMFRQGIGRLVRRDGLLANRRLHFLDARIHDKAWNRILMPVTRALSPYRRRIVV